MNQFNDFTPTKTVGGFTVDQSKDFRDSMSAILESMSQSMSMNPIHDISKILSNRMLKEQYKEKLIGDYVSESITDPYYQLHADKLEQLFENSAFEILRENSVAQLAPVVGLTLPILKKSYTESVAKDIVMTEVSPQPVVKKQFERKFMKDKAGKKYYVPEIFYNEDWKALAAQAKGKAIPDTFYPTSSNLPMQDFDLLGEAGGSVEKRDTLGSDLHIKEVKMTVKDSSGSGTEEIDIQVNIIARLDEQHVSHYRVVGYGKDSAKTMVEDTLIFIVDWYKGTVSVSSTSGAIKKVKFGGHLSNQNNTETIELDKEREGFTWNMEEGVRINTGITVERIKDMKSMMNSDWTSELVSDMSSMITQFEDNDVLSQLNEAYYKWKDVKDLPLGYSDGFVAEIKFKCIPPTGSLLSTSEYLEKELQFSVTKFINTLKNKLKETDIMFVMHGHPENIDLALSGIDWVISDDAKLGGVTLGYKFGINANNGTRIHVVSSLKEKKSDGIMLTAYSLNDNTFTFKTWKYSMNIENVYRNPLTPNTPNLMGTSRYKFAYLQPVQGKIVLVDNDYGRGVKDAG